MTDRKTYRSDPGIGPMGAVATVPGEFLASAIVGVVQGACSAGEAIGRAVGRLRRR